MEKTKKIRVEKTERGVEVFIDPEVTKISKGDITFSAYGLKCTLVARWTKTDVSQKTAHIWIVKRTLYIAGTILKFHRNPILLPSVFFIPK